MGTFTPQGSFDAIIPRLPALKNLGVTAIELMPMAQFPGNRNWGYDGAYPYAVQASYGGPLAARAEITRQCMPDFHHALHVLLIGEQDGYYEDFCGIDDLAGC